MNQIYHHVGRFYRLEGRINLRLWQSPVIILCSKCTASIGFSDGSYSRKISEKYEKSGRYEDLAQFYEALGMLEKAGEVRNRLRQHTVKQVNIDLNALLDKVAVGGLAIPYRCRSCGATLTIDSKSKPNGIAFCSYCGSALDTDSLVALLKLALG